MANEQNATSWWRLNETAGADALDMRGVNNGTYNGGVVQGGAAGATFDGATGYVSIPDSATLDNAVADSWWIAARVTRGALGANRTIMSKGNGGWNLRLDATGKPQLVKSNVAVLVQAPAAIDANPHVIAASKTSGSNLLKLFVDGVLVASATPAAGAMPVATNLPLTIGCDAFSAGGRQEFWNGVISGVGFSQLPLVGPIVEPCGSAIGGGPGVVFLPMPAFLTAFRDPAAVNTTTVPVVLEIVVLHGATPQVGNCAVQLQATGGGGSGTVYLNVSLPVVNGIASTGFNVQYRDADVNLTGTISANNGGAVITTWNANLRASFAIARVAPNVELGDGVSGLAVSSAMATLAKPIDAASIWYRAMTGPAATDYAPGSAWTTDLATAAGFLPATGAHIGVQFQLVRAT
jgi:Concanavalin A-like lectin/glucanases superfamily